MSRQLPTRISMSCSRESRPDIALIVVDETDWVSSLPYGLAYFNDDAGQIRPGIVVMPAGGRRLLDGDGQGHPRRVA